MKQVLSREHAHIPEHVMGAAIVAAAALTAGVGSSSSPSSSSDQTKTQDELSSDEKKRLATTAANHACMAMLGKKLSKEIASQPPVVEQSAYEKQRLANIAANYDFLASLDMELPKKIASQPPVVEQSRGAKRKIQHGDEAYEDDISGDDSEDARTPSAWALPRRKSSRTKKAVQYNDDAESAEDATTEVTAEIAEDAGAGGADGTEVAGAAEGTGPAEPAEVTAEVNIVAETSELAEAAEDEAAKVAESMEDATAEFTAEIAEDAGADGTEIAGAAEEAGAAEPAEVTADVNTVAEPTEAAADAGDAVNAKHVVTTVSLARPTHQELKNSQGMFILYLYIEGDDQEAPGGKAHAIVAKVLTAVIEKGILWLDTDDYTCDKDQYFPATLNDGIWWKASHRRTNESWVHAGKAFVMCLLSSLTAGGKLTAPDARRALAILQKHQDDHPHAKDFIARLSETRPPKAARKRKK